MAVTQKQVRIYMKQRQQDVTQAAVAGKAGNTTLAMVYLLMLSTQKRWRAIKGFRLLTLVVNDVEFKDGTAVDQSARKAA